MVWSLLNGIRCPGMINSREVKEIMPSPPTCISIKITICPNRLKAAVSTVLNPVTQTAEVEMNSASIAETALGYSPPPAHETGRQSKTVPALMINIKNASR